MSDRKRNTRPAPKRPTASFAFAEANSTNIPTPVETELATGFIEWGKQNKYPWYLNELRYNNAIHGGIIEHKINYITAGGYEVEGNEADKAKQFLSNGTGHQDFDDIYAENAADKVVFNGMAIRCVWQNNGKAISFFESIDFDKVRVKVSKTNTDRVVMYAISDDWTAGTQNKLETNYREIPPYDPNNRKGEFLLYFSKPTRRTDKKDLSVYPKPEYMGGIKAVNTDNRIDTYHLNEIANGFKTGTIVSFNDGKMNSPEEEKQLAERIRESATGEDDAGGTVVFFSNGKDKAPTVTHLNGNDLDKRYLQLESATQQKILTAHGITTPGLFGIKTAGQLGGQDELETGFAIFKNTYVKSTHRFMQSAYNYLLKLAGIDARIVLNLPSSPFASDDNDTTAVEEVGTPEQMSKQDKDPILDALSKVGIKKKYVKVVDTIELPNEFTREDLQRREKLMLKKVSFAEELTPNEATVLDAIINGDDIDELQIEGLTDDEISSAVEGLKEKGFLTEGNNPTQEAPEAIEETTFEIMYEYAKRAGVPPVKTSSRPFCKELIAMDLLYTREEIEQISSAVDRDVWRYRGGWYHNPETGQNTPFCRHVWKQVVVQTN